MSYELRGNGGDNKFNQGVRGKNQGNAQGGPDNNLFALGYSFLVAAWQHPGKAAVDEHD